MGRDGEVRLLCPACFALPFRCGCFRDAGLITQTPGGLMVWSLGCHEGVLQGLIQRLKYNSETFIADWLGAAMAELETPWQEIDGLVPVPLHPLRLIERGYNQAGLLARRIAKSKRKTTLHAAAQRRTATQAQALLGRSERKENVRGIFDAAPTPTPRSVVIVDDVITTGSTAEELRSALSQAGYKVLGALTVSVARPKSR